MIAPNPTDDCHPYQNLFVGAAARVISEDIIEVGLSIHDGTYSIDFTVAHVHRQPNETTADSLKRTAKDSIDKFCEEHHGKFIGAGVTSTVRDLCPDIAEYLWRECDIVVMAFDVKTKIEGYTHCEDGSHSKEEEGESGGAGIEIGVDEQADSAVRKCIMHFGPQMMPMLAVGFRNKVEVDIAGNVQLVHSLESYKKTVSEQTWKCVLHFGKRLRERKVKIAFFSATPQGGGVALMRHALIRFLKLLGVDANWLVKMFPS